MKIAVFGSTGRVGAFFTQKAIAGGHEIVALVRQEKFSTDEITFHVGDARNEKDVDQTVEGCDVVFVALNTDKTNTLSVAIKYIIQAMEKHNISRIVTIGTAGIVESRVEAGKLRYQSSESRQKVKFAASEHEYVYRALQKTALDWTIICPTALIDDENMGIYRYEIDYLPKDGRKISTSHTAELSYKALVENLFHQKRVGLAY
ncbi:MAG: NAD(P)H-binding protein, partial [Lysinibacillus sp.]